MTTTKPSKPTLEPHRLDMPIRDWHYRITSGEVIKALYGHGFFKPQRLSFTKIEGHVVYWEASYRNGRTLTGTLLKRVCWSIESLPTNSSKSEPLFALPISERGKTRRYDRARRDRGAQNATAPGTA